MIDADALNRIDALLQSITAGPWFWNSYSAIFSAPYQKVANELEDLHEAAGSPWDERGNYPEPWASEAKHGTPVVAWVPASYGDTATGRHAADAEFIENARTLMPLLLAEVRRLRSEAEPRIPPHHPGIRIAERLQERQMLQRELAAALGISVSLMNGIILGQRRLTNRTCRALAQVFGDEPFYWFDLQQHCERAAFERGEDR